MMKNTMIKFNLNKRTIKIFSIFFKNYNLYSYIYSYHKNKALTIYNLNSLL